MSKFPFEAAVGTLIPFSGSAVASFITRQNIKNWYDPEIRKPWWRPPNWMFGPVWTCLYGSMGYASYLVWRDGHGLNGEAKVPLMVYGSHLILNWAFTPLFFGKKDLRLALINIIALDVGIIATMWQFYNINTTATYIFTPYLGWCLFATALTTWIYKNNKDGKHLD